MNQHATRIFLTAALTFGAGGAISAQEPAGAGRSQNQGQDQDQATVGPGGSIRFGTTVEGEDPPAPKVQAAAGQPETPGASAIRPQGFDPYGRYRPNWS